MFGIQPTPYDLQFEVFRIPVRVLPTFWIFTILMNWSPDALDQVLVWTMCVFLAILVHELGHALIAEMYLWPSHILIYHFGGLAFYDPRGYRSPWKEMSISLAGPFAGFVFSGILFPTQILLTIQGVELPFYADLVIANLHMINIFWGCVNLLPVLPLDGGHVMQSFFRILKLKQPELWATRISVGVAAAAAYVLLSMGIKFGGMLFGFLCLQNIMTLQEQRGRW